jgi:hypothetical protein
MKNLKILFLSADSSDYLNISLLHGLKSLENVEVIDYPKSEVSYVNYQAELRPFVRGNGFTLFFNLDDQNQNRFHIKYDLVFTGQFDLIIFGDIKSSYGIYLELFSYLKKTTTAILDGSDDPSLFGNHGDFWRKPYLWFIPKPQNNFLYFKREWIPSDINKKKFFNLLPNILSLFIPQNKHLRRISFSIPKEKIVKEFPVKIKMFPTHIVDQEISDILNGKNKTNYAFKDESDYYNDLASSKFGITTKRAGWDCLRHYEIAANGSVICFKDLNKKPSNCAPHDLVPGENCISYTSFTDLMSQIDVIDEKKYNELQRESLKWIKTKTTEIIAKSFLNQMSINL